MLSKGSVSQSEEQMKRALTYAVPSMPPRAIHASVSLMPAKTAGGIWDTSVAMAHRTDRRNVVSAGEKWRPDYAKLDANQARTRSGKGSL